MTAAVWPRSRALTERLLWINPKRATYRDMVLAGLASIVRTPDIIVVNDAATLPASLTGRSPAGRPVEVRLTRRYADDTWGAILFGGGDWRTPTEHRPAPDRVTQGDVIHFDAPFDAAQGRPMRESKDDLSASVTEVSSRSPRAVRVRFSQTGAAFWAALYRHGQPIQYAHISQALPLWHVQTSYGSRPWAIELPSAGKPFNWALLLELRRQGVAIGTVTHACGLSSTGDPALDAALPLPETFDIPVDTVARIQASRSIGGRVIAVGTSVVRALEGAAALHGGRLEPGIGDTDLVVDASFRPRVVDGLLTGMHEPGSSHLRLLQAFAPAGLLEAAYVHAEQAGYLGHEFGDTNLILNDEVHP